MDTTLTMKIATPASTDPREFLAMRARQKKAQLRIRRFKLALLALGLAGGLGAVLGLPRWRQRLSVAPEARAAALAEVPGTSAVASPALALPVPTPAAPVTSEPVVEAPAAVEAASSSGCQVDFTGRQWRAAIESCKRAFEADPDAATAMQVAHAHFAAGHPARAGEWATRAVQLGSTDADAQVLIGHAHRSAGQPERAIGAYRRYLRSAPHGWHAARVRAAIRELKPAVSEGSDN